MQDQFTLSPVLRVQYRYEYRKITQGTYVVMVGSGESVQHHLHMATRLCKAPKVEAEYAGTDVS